MYTKMIALIVIILAFLSAEAEAQTLIDFEDTSIPTGSTMSVQYGNRGVIFQSGYLDTDPAAHSGQRVVRAIAPGGETFEPTPLIIYFTGQHVSRVKLFASAFAAQNGRLTAFDSESGGNVVAVDGHFVAQKTFTTAFQVTSSTGNIKRVEVRLDSSPFLAIDDLEFDGDISPVPTQPPLVEITLPINGIDVDIPGDLPRLDIAGTVTGEGLLSDVTVTVTSKHPPEYTAPPLRLVLSLTGSGPTRQFALAGGMTPLPPGPITVTATAENIAGLKGTDTNTLTNLPRAVRDKFFDLGGTNTLGEFQYGLLSTCAIAVYERGAISGQNGGAIPIVGDVFTKWLSLRGPYNQRGWFGCPTNDEGNTVGGARFQNFERGRIYAKLPGIAPPGAVYVPAVFVDAIDKRGGDAGVGLPLADPTDSAGQMRTWLFQRFDRPDDDTWILPSTLEIRGTPPILWMERQIGPWFKGAGLDDGNVFNLSDFDRQRNKTGATLWEGFPCGDDKTIDKNLGPCRVSVEPEFPPPIAPQNKPDFKNQFCNGSTYIPASPFGPPEWKSVRGQYDVTPVFGAIISASMATIDNGLTHKTHNGNCPYIGGGLSIGSALSGVPIAFGANVLAEEYGLTCASDFEFYVRPLGPQIDTMPQLPSLFGEKNTDRIKTEYEVAYAAEAHNFLGPPAKGDLVYMTGRWIVDCGHPTYKTELHPLFSFARAKTVVSETNTFTQLEETLFGGKPATRVAVWVNGWYPGGDNNPIEFNIYPPPRPSPNAVLHVVKPMDFGPGNYKAAVDVQLEDSIEPKLSASYVRLRFTAPPRGNGVTRDGEMLFRPGRQYWGIWYLYWE